MKPEQIHSLIYAHMLSQSYEAYVFCEFFVTMGRAHVAHHRDWIKTPMLEGLF